MSDSDLPIVGRLATTATAIYLLQRLRADATQAGLSEAATNWWVQALDRAVGELRRPQFPDVSAWVTGWLVPVLEHRLGSASDPGWCWCPKWWAHPLALNRFYALWAQWERSAADGDLSDWWVTHADPTLAVLTGDDGPFHRCVTEHEALPEYPVEPAPPGVLDQLPDGGPFDTGDPDDDPTIPDHDGVDSRDGADGDSLQQRHR